MTGAVPDRRTLRTGGVALGVTASVLAVLLVAVGLGPIPTAPVDVLSALGRAVQGAPASGVEALILSVRLPRIVVAALVGAALAVSGVVMQAVFRNPLAEPGIVGVSSGAAVGAVIAVVVGGAAAAWWALPLSAFVGALAATLAVQAVAGLAGGAPTTLVLVGIAFNALLGAVVAALLANAPDASAVQGALFWLNGDLTARTWGDAAVAAAPILVCTVVLCCAGAVLDLFSLSEEQAAATGVPAVAARQALLATAALTTAAAVAVTGAISFVGLVVPHLVRLVVGGPHRRLLPLSAAAGAVFLVAADSAARLLFDPVVLQTGTVTALIGAPVLLLLVVRRRRGAA